MRHLRVLITLLSAVLAARTTHASGLLAPTDQTLPPLRVTDHLVDVTIRDGVAITTFTQTFHNDTKRRLEGTYVFPLPEQADLTNFQMTFNGKMVEGRVLPAQEARQIYESIVRQAKDPGLIEFIGRRLLQMRVFPIEPESDTTVQVRYQQICRPISGMSGYHYPLRTSKTSGQAYGTVRFAVDLHTAAALKNIWSPTHAVEIVRDGDHNARIAYEASGGSLEDDFMLLYDTDASDLGLSVIGYQPHTGKDGHFVLMLTPKQLWPEQTRAAQDVVFVLDTSGSMAGDKLKQAKAALRYCIEQLGERDRFGVVRFSTGFDTLFDPLVPATAAAREEARRWIEGFTAAGGTNIADTLEHVLTLRSADDADEKAARPFVVVFLTDGQGNRQPDAIMQTIHSGATVLDDALRIFPFGVGHDTNTVLLDRLATSYRGRPTYVQPGENLELVLGDFFSVISQPVLANLKLTLPGIGVTERFPAKLGDLYHGQQIVVAGKFANPATGPVKLTANRDGQVVEYSWPQVSFAHTAEATYVPAVWAGRKIAYLIDQIRAHGENEEMVAEVVALSQEHGIQTPYTSWLVDPERSLVARGGVGVRLGAGRPARELFARQRRVLESRTAGGGGAAPSAPATDAMYGGDLFLLDAEEAVGQSVGKAATVIAQRNAELRDQLSVDLARLDANLLARQRIEGLWYNRIGAYLVDERIDEQTEITVLRFASEAYFELVDERPKLRAALARGRHVMVIVAEGQAVLIADDEGVKSFTDEQRTSLEL